MAIPFIAQEISGVALQSYDNSAVPRSYIDTISGNLASNISDTPTNWGTLTEGTGIAPITGVGISGSGDHDITVLGYDTISSQARSAYVSASTGVFALQSINLTAGAGLTGGGTIDATRDFAVGEGTGILVNADDVEVKGYSTISSNAKAGADYVASGNEYSAAYDWYVASAQKLSDHNSGWASVPEDNPISHGLSAKPTNIQITPSGLVTFAYAISSITDTTFCVPISAPGNKMISWRAEV